MNGKYEILNYINEKFKCFYQDFEEIDWERISLSDTLTDYDLTYLSDYLIWDEIFAYQDKFDETILIKYINFIDDASVILVMRNFSLNFLLELLKINKIEWSDIAIFCKLSENDIDKYKEQLDWVAVCLHQEMSENFIISHKQYVYPNILIRQNKINDNILNLLLLK